MEDRSDDEIPAASRVTIWRTPGHDTTDEDSARDGGAHRAGHRSLSPRFPLGPVHHSTGTSSDAQRSLAARIALHPIATTTTSTPGSQVSTPDDITPSTSTGSNPASQNQLPYESLFGDDVARPEDAREGALGRVLEVPQYAPGDSPQPPIKYSAPPAGSGRSMPHRNVSATGTGRSANPPVGVSHTLHPPAVKLPDVSPGAGPSKAGGLLKKAFEFKAAQALRVTDDSSKSL